MIKFIHFHAPMLPIYRFMIFCYNIPCRLLPIPLTETHAEHVHVIIIEDVVVKVSYIPIELIRTPFFTDTKFSRNYVLTYGGEHAFWFFTFDNCFFTLCGWNCLYICGLWIFYNLGWFLQMRLIFFTFVVDFYIMENFYICGCNKASQDLWTYYFIIMMTMGALYTIQTVGKENGVDL